MFHGFCPETIDFLWNLRFNNNKAWLDDNKQVYLSTLQRPMKALADELFDPFRAIPSLHCTVSRIYRDTRIPQPVPYKDHLWISIRQKDAMYWGEVPTLFFELWPDHYGYGFVLWGPRAAVMERFRARIALRPGEFAEMVAQAEAKTGLTLSGAEYKRKKPCPDPQIARFYNLKNVLFCTSAPIGDELYHPELADTVREKLLHLLPIFDFFQNLTNEK